MKLKLMFVFLFVTACAMAQNAPQYQVNLSFLTGSPYGQSSALDVTFADQFTATSQLQGDIITMPGAGVTDYLGGVHYDITAACPLLATTSLSCGKFVPFVSAKAGLGRLQRDGVATDQTVAALVMAGADYDPTGAGKYGVILQAGWGRFGPKLAGQSNQGFVFYSGLSFGGGTNVAATQAKIAHIRAADAKKLKRLQKQAAKDAAKLAKP